MLCINCDAWNQKLISIGMNFVQLYFDATSILQTITKNWSASGLSQ